MYNIFEGTMLKIIEDSEILVATGVLELLTSHVRCSNQLIMIQWIM